MKHEPSAEISIPLRSGVVNGTYQTTFHVGMINFLVNF
jgi:hypothetical protein